MVKFSDSGSKTFMDPNDTEQFTGDILSVQTGYTTKMFWLIGKFIENFVSLDFWSEMKTICHASIVKFSDLGSKHFRWFIVPNDTEQTTEDISSVGYIGIQLKCSDLLRILWVGIFGPKF